MIQIEAFQVIFYRTGICDQDLFFKKKFFQLMFLSCSLLLVIFCGPLVGVEGL